MSISVSSSVSAGRVALDGILETHNVFGRGNVGSCEGRQGNANYGRTIPLLSLAYQPRMLQLGGSARAGAGAHLVLPSPVAGHRTAAAA